MKEKIEIIYKDKNFIAVNKPANLLVHQAKISNSQFLISKKSSKNKSQKEKTLVDWAVKKFPEIKKVGDSSASSEQVLSTDSTSSPQASSRQIPSTRFSRASAKRVSSGQVIQTRPGVVHRLDKDTSGVILIARNQKYFEYLKNLFQNHKVKKTYLALVWGKVKNKKGIINMPISLKTGTIKRTIHAGKMAKEAITEYEVLKTFEIINEKGNTKYFSLMRIFPLTGRTHQIRVHLASIGNPVVGDMVYGGKKENPFGLKRQFLHAQSIEFNTQENKRIRIEAELPEDLQKALELIEQI